MTNLSSYNNIFETGTYFLGNINVLLKHLVRGLGTKSPHSDPANKMLLGLCIVSNVSKWSSFLLKMGKNLLLPAPVVLYVLSNT